MKIELIENTDRFRALHEEWNALLERSSQTSVFLTWEWLFTWWTHFQGNKRLFILLFRDESSSELLAIAPWTLERRTRLRLLPVWKIAFLGTERVASDFMDLIILPGREKAVLECLCGFLRSQRDRWDLVELSDIEGGSPVLGLLPSFLTGQYRFWETPSEICPYIPLPPEYSLFSSSLSPKWRRYLRTHAQAVEEDRHMTYSVSSAPERLAQDMDRLFELHNHRFAMKSQGGRAISAFSGERIMRFHKEVAARFLSSSWLKLYFLEQEREPVACLYAFRYKDRVFAYQTGFNCALEKLGLGNVLFDHAIRDSIRTGAKEFHFLRGGEAYKQKWTKTARPLHNLVWINSNATGRLYALSLAAENGCRSLLGRLGCAGRQRPRPLSPPNLPMPSSP